MLFRSKQVKHRNQQYKQRERQTKRRRKPHLTEFREVLSLEGCVNCERDQNKRKDFQ